MQVVVKRIIFWIAIVFIGVTIFALSVGQFLPYEFADYNVMHNFYDILMHGIPIAILLTLFGTIKRQNPKEKNWSVLGVTVLTSFISFVIVPSLIFRICFGTWITATTIYRHKTEDKVIKEQLFDIGALSYGGTRIVEIKPILHFWILPTAIDTSTINKSEWEYVNEQGDIKFP